ncbi:hypothetical protein RJ640_007028 [Escallonia rubra]|uniref:Conserved oligomeric Golgi complex subunit 4 n=1 Tax=Escallonia rubra TaxID=112253 RepID=A0AA88R3E0_9ASTE|nr:hypothetical protein RJ640_007028 [Escallonia rubra]
MNGELKSKFFIDASTEITSCDFLDGKVMISVPDLGTQVLLGSNNLSLETPNVSTMAASKNGRFFSADTNKVDEPFKAEEAETVDVPPSTTEKLLVLGGNGFVGSHICKEALNHGLSVASLSSTWLIRSVDLSLDAIVSCSADLDRHLSSLLRSADVLLLVKSNFDLVLSNVESTSDLADRVSLKVRELDLTQSRVSHTLLRIDAIVERTACIDGVKKALAFEDFESAATFVQTFLQIDSKYRDSASDQREQLLASKKQLESMSIVRKRLSAAVDQRDHATILRFVRLYPPLGLEEEGLQAYVGYLKKVVSMRSRLEFDQLVELMEQSYSSSFVGNQAQTNTTDGGRSTCGKKET